MGQTIGRIEQSDWNTLKSCREAMDYFVEKDRDEAYRKEWKVYRDLIQRHYPEGDLNTLH